MPNSVLEVQDEFRARRHELASAVVDLHYERRPELHERYGPMGREKCLQDTGFHLDYLTEAAATGSPRLFSEYVVWASSMLESRGVPSRHLAFSLECLREVLRARLSDKAYGAVDPIIVSGLRAVGGLPAPAPADVSELDRAARVYLAALLERDWDGARAVVRAALEAGSSVQDVYLHVFERSQHEIGRLWQLGEISVAQEHLCTAATQRNMAALYSSHFFATPRKAGVAVVACVSGELHEVGARMVADFLALEGWDTLYLGASSPAAGIAAEAIDQKADVLVLSCTLTPHLGAVREVIEHVRRAGPAERPEVLVGGYPFNVDEGLWRRVGADGFARDARGAAALAAAVYSRRTRAQ